MKKLLLILSLLVTITPAHAFDYKSLWGNKWARWSAYLVCAGALYFCAKKIFASRDEKNKTSQNSVTIFYKELDLTNTEQLNKAFSTSHIVCNYNKDADQTGVDELFKANTNWLKPNNKTEEELLLHQFHQELDKENIITQVVAKIYVDTNTKEKQRKILGFIAVEKDNNSKKACIKYLAVNSKNRRQHIGTNLINSLVTDMQLDGFSEINVEFSSNNKAADGFFTKCGWEKTKTKNTLQFRHNLKDNTAIVIHLL